MQRSSGIEIRQKKHFEEISHGLESLYQKSTPEILQYANKSFKKEKDMYYERYRQQALSEADIYGRITSSTKFGTTLGLTSVIEREKIRISNSGLNSHYDWRDLPGPRADLHPTGIHGFNDYYKYPLGYTQLRTASDQYGLTQDFSLPPRY